MPEKTLKPISIPETIAARCDRPDQAERMDRLFRAVLTVPRSAVLKDTAKRKRERATKKIIAGLLGPVK